MRLLKLLLVMNLPPIEGIFSPHTWQISSSYDAPWYNTKIARSSTIRRHDQRRYSRRYQSPWNDSLVTTVEVDVTNVTHFRYSIQSTEPNSWARYNVLTKWWNGRPCKIHQVQSLYNLSNERDVLQCLATWAEADFCKKYKIIHVR